MNLSDVHAVIESARSRGRDPLERWVRGRIPEATEPEIREAMVAAEEIIDSVPLFLARAQQAAAERGVTAVVSPILERAARYFLSPVDLIPEMTQGMAGLLDDAYLVLRVMKNLDRGPEPLLDWELDEPIRFLKRLVGPKVSARLDDYSVRSMEEAESDFRRYWDAMSAQA
ncbi:MAG TPA: YkvA family protein [Longimicrobiales bacterium]|nr:YkvA family protein [Longimicrobiales bacterium]